MKLVTKLAILIAMLAVATLPMSAKDEEYSYNVTRALEEMGKDDPESAMKYAKLAIDENPKDGIAYLLLATLYIDECEYGEARKAAESALKYLPKKDKKSRAWAYKCRAHVFTIEGDTVAAYADLNSAVSLAPTDGSMLEARAQLYYEQARYDEADADYEKLVELNPGGVMGRMGLGRNAIARTDYASALVCFSKVIALHPTYSSGYSFRAETYLADGDYVKAIDDICEALKIDSDSKAYYLLYDFPAEQLPLVVAKLKALSVAEPHSSEYIYYIANLYSYNDLYLKAIDYYEQAYDIDAQYVFLENISDCYSRIGNYTKALEYINRAIEMKPDSASLIVKRADLLGESGDIDGAIAQWSRVVEMQPDNYYTYYRRGFFEDNDGRSEAALEDYNMAVMLNPDYAYAYLGKGDMLERLNRHDEALQAYQKVVELDTVPGNSSCAMYALLSLGRRDDAVAFMDRVLANDSTYAGNYYDAACFTCRLGDNAKALSYLRTALEKGFRRLYHIRHDDDLSALWNLPEFEALMSEYEPHPATSDDDADDNQEVTEILVVEDKPEVVEIPFTPAGGVFEVKCTINDLPLNFIFDTGASTVTLSMLEANFMMKNGYLKPTDVVGSQYFYDALGDISEGTVINLRQIDFGGLKLENVHASVVRNQKAPLLLGQSVLGRLGKIEIDNKDKKLIIHPTN